MRRGDRQTGGSHRNGRVPNVLQGGKNRHLLSPTGGVNGIVHVVQGFE